MFDDPLAAEAGGYFFQETQVRKDGVHAKPVLTEDNYNVVAGVSKTGFTNEKNTDLQTGNVTYRQGVKVGIDGKDISQLLKEKKPKLKTQSSSVKTGGSGKASVKINSREVDFE
jgi:hypothetical protein